jgi:glycosyltransferase involved in cell wall biosynthesis
MGIRSRLDAGFFVAQHEYLNLMDKPRPNWNPTVSVVIPCLNERETIHAAVLEALQGLKLAAASGEVIVADNGSNDGSQEIAQAAGARVVHVPARGYGSALHHGILASKTDIVVFGDADLSYPFLEIPTLLGPIREETADFVLGSRLLGKIDSGAMPMLNRRIGTPILSFLIRVFYRLPTSDCNSGMRAVRRDRYEVLQLACPGMEYASEMLVRVAQVELRYVEVPIGFRKDRRSRPPHLRRWRDGWRHLRFILGGAPELFTIAVPGLSGSALLTMALVLSWSFHGSQYSHIHFHTAFSLIAIAMPLMIFTVALMLVKAVRHEAGVYSSKLVILLHKLSENAAPFYVSLGIYALALLQIVIMFFHWRTQGFNELFDMAPVIRLMVFSTTATVIFSLDLGLGLLRLIPYKKNVSG